MQVLHAIFVNSAQILRNISTRFYRASAYWCTILI